VVEISTLQSQGFDIVVPETLALLVMVLAVMVVLSVLPFGVLPGGIHRGATGRRLRTLSLRMSAQTAAQHCYSEYPQNEPTHRNFPSD
jgi:hypothetical protein